MKKRIFSALICAVIAALSVLTAFSGCTGEKQAKEVMDRNAFFSEMAGRYVSGGKSITINTDGTFQVILSKTTTDENKSYSYLHDEYHRFSGSFYDIYMDNENEYHSSISKLKKIMSLYDTPVGNTVTPEPDYNNIFSQSAIKSNDIIYFFTAGTYISDYLDIINFKEMFSDNTMQYCDSNGKLTDNILYNYISETFFFPDNNNDYLYNGVWVDYTAHSSEIYVYKFNYNDVTATRYNISQGEKVFNESVKEVDKMMVSVAFDNDYNYSKNVKLYIENERPIVLEVNGELNKLEYMIPNQENPKKRQTHILYNYTELPKYNDLVNFAKEAINEFSDKNK